MNYRQMVVIFLCLQSTSTFAQTKQVNTVDQVWTAWLNQTKFSSNWGFWLDAQVRTKNNFVDEFSQAMVRGGITYYFKPTTKVTAGYAFVNHFPDEGHTNISQPEHRPWQQIQWHRTTGKVKWMQWVRLEERFRRKILNNDALADGYLFNWRVRYNVLMQYPLGKKPYASGSLSAVLNNELMLNAGKKIVYNTFDQNRFFVGFNWFVSAHDWVQIGYLNVWQQLSAGTKFKQIQGIRLSYFQNLDISHKGTSK